MSFAHHLKFFLQYTTVFDFFLMESTLLNIEIQQ